MSGPIGIMEVQHFATAILYNNFNRDHESKGNISEDMATRLSDDFGTVALFVNGNTRAYSLESVLSDAEKVLGNLTLTDTIYVVDSNGNGSMYSKKFPKRRGWGEFRFGGRIDGSRVEL